MGRRAFTSTTELGGAIRSKRLAKGWKIVELAKMCGISVSYLSRIETGDIQRPHDDVLAKIGQHLGIHMTEIRRLISAPTKNDLIIKSSEIREKLEKIAEDLESIRNALEKMTK